MSKKIIFSSSIFGMAIIILSLSITAAADQKAREEETSKKGKTVQADSKSPLMQPIKFKGCVADGILSGYGKDTTNQAEVIRRSECAYLHRALETWAHPPDFSKAQEIMDEIDRPDLIYGMFLAEAINPKAKMRYSDERRGFKFSEMCKKGTKGAWGDNTCKADLSSEEYQKYLKYITEQAIDMGIQSFLFGQIHFQERDLDNPAAPAVVSEMRQYAREKGKEIVIGAQTNDITDEEYLRIFDYIEGGVGQNAEGKIEDKECSSKWGWCWALLWHDKYAKKANDVVLHLDWSGFQNDDMSIYAKMDKDTREKTLKNLYNYFTGKNMGFLMPYLAVVNSEINGCHGPRKDFYSPGDMYNCKDEGAMSQVLARGEKDDALFISQSVPPVMQAGERYMAVVTFKNNGTTSWKKDNLYRLGETNADILPIWGGRADLAMEDLVKPGEEKTFSFYVTAPKKSGKYDFQWKMMEEFSGWFGQESPKLSIEVRD